MAVTPFKVQLICNDTFPFMNLLLGVHCYTVKCSEWDSIWPTDARAKLNPGRRGNYNRWICGELNDHTASLKTLMAR